MVVVVSKAFFIVLCCVTKAEAKQDVTYHKEAIGNFMHGMTPSDRNNRGDCGDRENPGVEFPPSL